MVAITHYVKVVPRRFGPGKLPPFAWPPLPENVS
jgi:hypothetical protein